MVKRKKQGKKVSLFDALGKKVSKGVLSKKKPDKVKDLSKLF